MSPRDRDQQKRDGEKRDLGQQVEGRRAVRELLVAGRRRVNEIWLSGDIEEIEALAEDTHTRVRRVPADQLERRARTNAPQGVVAFAAPIVPADVDQMLADPAAFLVALDGVTDPQNLGAVMRTAETAGATGVVLPRHRAVGLTPAVAKAAAGALEYLPVAFVSGIPGVLERAARAHVWCVGLDADGDTPIFALPVADQPLVLVLGAEGRGLSRLARSRCEVVASIPMHGSIESLNVSAAAAIACTEIARQREVARMSEPDDTIVITTLTTEALTAAHRSSVIDVCIAAHDNEDFSNLFAYIPSGGRHFLAYRGPELVSHAVTTTRWVQPDGQPVLKTAYVDAVSTLPAYQGRGYASATMRRLAAEINDYEIACLQTDIPEFYGRLGWEVWRGALAGRGERGLIPTPEQRGVMVLRLPRTPPLDLQAQLSIECQPGRVWE